MENWEKAYEESEKICSMPVEKGIEYITNKYHAEIDIDGVYHLNIWGVPTAFFKAFADSETLYFEN